MPAGYQCIWEIWLNYPRSIQTFTESLVLATSQCKRPSECSLPFPLIKHMNRTMRVSRAMGGQLASQTTQVPCGGGWLQDQRLPEWLESLRMQTCTGTQEWTQVTMTKQQVYRYLLQRMFVLLWPSLRSWATHLRRRARTCLSLIPRKLQILL